MFTHPHTHCLHNQARLYEVENEGRPMTVRRASKLLANNIARWVEGHTKQSLRPALPCLTLTHTSINLPTTTTTAE